jgi:opacity protein-like surface antigen
MFSGALPGGRCGGRLQRDASRRDGRGAQSLPNGAPVGAGGIAWTNALDSIATVRGRIGYVWMPNFMDYFTGGGAWGRTSYASVDNFGACPNCAVAAFSNTSSGYVLGGGVALEQQLDRARGIPLL